MIAFFLSFIASATDATYIRDHLTGNWSTTLTHPGLQPSESTHFHVSFIETPTKTFEVLIFEDENDVSPISTFSIAFIDGQTVTIKSKSDGEEEATRVSVTMGMKYHHTAVGLYKQYVFNFNYANPARMLITLFDNEKDEMTIIHLLKQVPQKTFFQKYGMTVFAVLAFGLSMFLNYKFKPAMPAPQQQPKEVQKKRVDTAEAKEEKKIAEEPKEKDNEPNGDQKKNTRDDEDENGKVKTE